MLNLKLNHVNIRTNQLNAMIAWYSDVLGLKQGKRPNFKFNGAWLYAGEQPVVHLVEINNDNLTGAEADLKLEHFAFSAQNRPAFEDNLTRLGITYRAAELTDVNLVQINIWDIDGNHIHVDFKLDAPNP